MLIKTKSIYEGPEESDGRRVYVERLWPRGLTRDEARVDDWLREIAPNEGMLAWFSGKPERWDEFEEDFFDDLNGRAEQISQLFDIAMEGPVTLLYDYDDPKHNSAVAVRDYLEKMLPDYKKAAA